MICGHCKSEEFHEGKIKLKSGAFQVLIYCANCGQIMSRKAVRPMPEPKVRKTWEERKAASAMREAARPKKMSWEERKARKGLHPKQAPTALPETNPQQSQPTDDAEPF